MQPRLLRIFLTTAGIALAGFLVAAASAPCYIVTLSADRITGSTRETTREWGLYSSDTIVWQSPLDAILYPPGTPLNDRRWKTYSNLKTTLLGGGSRGCSRPPRSFGVHAVDPGEMPALVDSFQAAVDRKAGWDELQKLVEDSLR